MVATEHPKALTEFIWFRKLPLELRMEIWEIAVPAVEGRVIEIMFDEPCFRFYTPTQVPGVLQADRESRGVALRQLEQIEISTADILHLEPSTTVSPTRFTTCINYNCDVLYICPTSFTTVPNGTHLMRDFLEIFVAPHPSRDPSYPYTPIPGMNRPRLQHIAVDIMDVTTADAFDKSLSPLARMTMLQSISLVNSDRCLRAPDLSSYCPCRSCQLVPHRNIVSMKEKKLETTFLRHQKNLRILNVGDNYSSLIFLAQRLKDLGMDYETGRAISILLVDIMREEDVAEEDKAHIPFSSPAIFSGEDPMRQ